MPPCSRGTVSASSPVLSQVLVVLQGEPPPPGRWSRPWRRTSPRLRVSAVSTQARNCSGTWNPHLAAGEGRRYPRAARLQRQVPIWCSSIMLPKAIPKEHLLRVGAHQAVDLPVRDSVRVQLAARFDDVLHRQRHVRHGRVFGVAPGGRRLSRCAHEMDLRRLGAIADVEPEPRHAGDVGPSGIGGDAQHVHVEAPGLGHGIRGGFDADAVVVQLQDLGSTWGGSRLRRAA